MILIVLGLLLIILGFYLMKCGFKLLSVLSIIFLVFVFLCCGGMIVHAYEYTPEEMVLIGKIVQHECPHESELGQRLVIDTIMNRVESDAFPNTVKEVLEQPGQYCSPKKYPPNYIYTLIAQEAYTRTNSQVVYYRTKKYHSYGTPILQEGSHFFSGR